MNMKILAVILLSFTVTFLGVLLAIHGDATLGIIIASGGALTFLTLSEG
jgi:hypothetical protein|tara:strand:+ start:460 stop:606 length:147 start_codon:yes stop_codon:yes gene_type:complete